MNGTVKCTHAPIRPLPAAFSTRPAAFAACRRARAHSYSLLAADFNKRDCSGRASQATPQGRFGEKSDQTGSGPYPASVMHTQPRQHALTVAAQAPVSLSAGPGHRSMLNGRVFSLTQRLLISFPTMLTPHTNLHLVRQKRRRHAQNFLDLSAALANLYILSGRARSALPRNALSSAFHLLLFISAIDCACLIAFLCCT